MRPGLRRCGEALAVLAVYTGIAAALTWPAVAHLDEVIIGGGELGGWLWRQWWHLTELEALLIADAPAAERVLVALGLGRYPETGNILDVVLLAWPLQGLFGLVAGYNLQVLGTLAINGLCGYTLARSLSAERGVALAAGLVAVVNPVCLQDVEASGLRQVLLWWLLLLPIPLRRALDTGSAPAAALAGLLLGLCGAFYWFYGLFAGMLVVAWLLLHLWSGRGRWRETLGGLRWLGDLALFAAVVVVPTMTPYVLDEGDGAGVGRTSELPELTWGVPFPDLDTIEAVPLRPSNPEENLLSSLQRGLMSSWSPDWLLNPGHRRALPAAVFWLGVLPLLARSRWREPAILAWLVVIALFWAGTLGPFLKPPGGQLDTAAVVLVGGEAVRLPWTWMFQWVPGMARMFAPYRMGAVVVVAAVALLALSLSRAPGGAWVRRGLGLVVVGATVLQAVWRWDIEDEGPDARRVQAPLQVSAIRLPDFYADLPVQAGAGLLELPLNQQQDLICLYQRFHGRKVYRGWATAGAVPPLFRAEGGGAAGARLRHLAAQDGYSREVDQALLRLSEDPAQADLSTLSDADLDLVLAAGGYRHVIVHERGYWLVDPQEGAARYRAAVAALADRLGVSAAESTDVAWFDHPGNRHQANQPARVPWTASRVAVHDDALPRAFRMAVFDVGERVSGFEGVIPKIGNSAPGEAPRVHHEGASRDLLLVVVPGLSGDPAEGGPLAAFAAGLGRPPTERFLAAQAQSLSPFLGLGSLLTGRHAAALPLCSLNGGDPRMGENSATTWCSQLPRGIQTCPQGLGIVGYHTGATVADAGQLGDPERRDPLLVQLLGWWQAAAGQPRFGLLVVPDLALGDADPVETARGLGAGLDVVLDTLTERNEGVAPWVLLTSTTGRTGPEAPAWLGPGDVHVPLWVFDPAAPQGPPRDHAELVSLLDVAPTLWRLGGAPVPEDLPGADLFDERAPRGGAYTASGDRLAWREGDWLLSFRAGLDDAVALDPRVTDRLLNHDVDGGGWYRLHHVAPGADPTVDHLAAEPERAAQLRQGLLEARTGPAAPPADRLTPARLEALRRLNSGDPW